MPKEVPKNCLEAGRKVGEELNNTALLLLSFNALTGGEKCWMTCWEESEAKGEGLRRGNKAMRGKCELGRIASCFSEIDFSHSGCWESEMAQCDAW